MIKYLAILKFVCVYIYIHTERGKERVGENRREGRQAGRDKGTQILCEH